MAVRDAWGEDRIAFLLIRGIFMGAHCPQGHNPWSIVHVPPRHEFWYVNDDGQIVAIRYQDWKAVFLENRAMAFEVWREPFVELRIPLLFNLRRDPFEKAQHNSNTYNDWFLARVFIIVPLQGLAAGFLQSMVDYPPSQSPGSFNLTAIQEKLKRGASPGS